MVNFSEKISILDRLFGPRELRKGGKVLDCGCGGIKPVAFAQRGGRTWIDDVNEHPLMEAGKVVDPLGITSYYDVHKAWTDGEFNHKDILEPLGALPLVGKMTSPLKAYKVYKATEKLRKINKAVDKLNIPGIKPLDRIVENITRNKLYRSGISREKRELIEESAELASKIGRTDQTRQTIASMGSENRPSDYTWDEYFNRTEGYIDEGNEVHLAPMVVQGTKKMQHGGTYTVKRGDNLKQFGVNINDIAYANDIKNINKIYTGQRLVKPTNKPKEYNIPFYLRKPEDTPQENPLTKIVNFAPKVIPNNPFEQDIDIYEGDTIELAPIVVKGTPKKSEFFDLNVSKAIIPSKDLKTYFEDFYDFYEYGKKKDRYIGSESVSKEFNTLAKRCNNGDNGQCLSTVLNYDSSYSPNSSNTIRADIADAFDEFKKYSIESGDPDKEYKHNNSVDSWEFHDFLRKEKGYIEHKGDYRNVPIGTVIGIGDARGIYIPKKGEAKPRHSLQVVAFTDAGEPVVNNMGKLALLADFKDSENIWYSIPPQYKNYTFNKINKNLGLNRDVKLRTKNEDIKTGVKTIAKQLVRETGVPLSVVEGFANHLDSLANRESKTGESIERQLTDNDFGNNVLKPAVKHFLDVLTEKRNRGKQFLQGVTERAVQPYKLEIQAYEQHKGDENKRNDLFLKLLEENKDRLQIVNHDDNKNSSVGVFSTKTLSPLAEKFGLNKKDLQAGIGTSTDLGEQIKKGSQAALIHLTELAKEAKKRYPNLSDNQIIEASLVGYSNRTKFEDPKFIKYYIQDKVLKDDILEKIKNYK